MFFSRFFNKSKCFDFIGRIVISFSIQRFSICVILCSSFNYPMLFFIAISHKEAILT